MPDEKQVTEEPKETLRSVLALAQEEFKEELKSRETGKIKERLWELHEAKRAMKKLERQLEKYLDQDLEDV